MPTLFGPTAGPFTIAGLALRTTYRFNRSIGSDRIAREDVRIYRRRRPDLTPKTSRR